MPIDPNSPFGAPADDWTQEDESTPSQTITNPNTAPITPDDDAAGVAKQWVGQMTRIGPNLYVEDKTAALLTAIHALGLPMGSQQEIMFLCSLMEDNSILADNISWFNPQEWQTLLGWLSHLPSKVGYVMSMFRFIAATSPESELLKALTDLGFEISSDSPKTMKLLQLLASSRSQSAGLAKQILAMDPATQAKLFAPQPLGENPSLQRSVPQNDQSKLQDVMKKHHPNYGMDLLPQTKQDLPPVSQNPELKMTMPEVNKYGIDPVMSVNVGQSGAIAKGKQIADFTHRYEDFAQGLPAGVKAAPYGEPIPRQQVFPAGGGTPGGGGLQNVPVKGGMFLKNNKDGVDAMAIGLASGGLLAVRLFPSGEYDQWDLMGSPVEVSRNRPPKRDY